MAGRASFRRPGSLSAPHLDAHGLLVEPEGQAGRLNAVEQQEFNHTIA
jgi:hypothetical protein